ncbi:hypothetical protein B0E46_15825 [Rhodanobacter sp. B04]|uniref:hypothetical protein n=1 Tax=Rhodanobacter sp. B04 TaxID=1945860 RepID=UPI000987972A|nr:hypothetical protein [Rhodanobacter sp. B04]OOG61444.1 hypothetical protein B0E46_15825 [Rhodanobacter sp. B04]
MSAVNAGAPPPAEQKAGKTAEAVVAHGRSVINGEGVRVGPGKTVALPVGEVRQLRKLGFLIGADEEFIASRPGPNLKVSDGPTVRLAS